MTSSEPKPDTDALVCKGCGRVLMLGMSRCTTPWCTGGRDTTARGKYSGEDSGRRTDEAVSGSLAGRGRSEETGLDRGLRRAFMLTLAVSAPFLLLIFGGYRRPGAPLSPWAQLAQVGSSFEALRYLLYIPILLGLLLVLLSSAVGVVRRPVMSLMYMLGTAVLLKYLVGVGLLLMLHLLVMGINVH